MFSIVATLDEFWGMLLGANIPVFTDHKNLTFDTLIMQRMLRWHTKMEEFCPCYTTLKAPATFLLTTFQGSIV